MNTWDNQRMRKVWALYLCAFVCGVLACAAAVVALATTQRPAPLISPLATSTAALAQPTPAGYEVLDVVDGDTLDVRIGTTSVRLRLIGMDTPEVVDSRKPVQCFGPEASAEGHKLLEHQWVRLEYDAVTGKTDIYGRTLAYVYLPDGTLYNEFMIRHGFAHEYDYQNQKYMYRTRFQSAQTAAKQEQLGFWSPSTCDGNTTKPEGAR